jgi:hypothetical protein
MLILLANVGYSYANETLAFQNKDKIYLEFREKFKFHFQMIGLAQFLDSSALFVIAEPNMLVSETELKSCFTSFTCDFAIKQHKIGYDGFVKDVLVSVENISKNDISAIIDRLSFVLYYSDYKAENAVVELPIKENRKYFGDSLNYEISLAELNKWFITENEKFVDFDDNTTFSVKDVLSSNKKGLFFSEKAGFVIWVINKREDFKAQQKNIRKFTLDADLILGGFSNTEKLIIIGRERESSLFELPPLNVETIMLFASIQDAELSQSLDIFDVLSGKMQNNKDWCPTYLSKELENTEFGHLLTIVDILLKDWSEHGNLRYEDYDYPKPVTYPFDMGLFDKLNLEQLVYNWNTENSVNYTTINSYNIYSLNRTGSLPVSYFSSQDIKNSIEKSYEQQAYKYFATINNTDLVRVMQYAALYSLFKNNDVFYNGFVWNNNFPKNKPYLLKDKMQMLLSNIKNLSQTGIQTILKAIAEDQYKIFKETKDIKQFDTLKIEIDKFIVEWEKAFCNNIITEIQTYTNDFYRQQNDSIVKWISEMRIFIDNEIQRIANENNVSRKEVENEYEIKKQIDETWATFNENIEQTKQEQKNELNRQITEYKYQQNQTKDSILQYVMPQMIVDSVFQKPIIDELKQLKKQLKTLDEKSFSDVCSYLSYPRGESYIASTTIEKAKKISKYISDMIGSKKAYYKYFGIDMSEIKNYYSNKLSNNYSNWIKTPSLVIIYETKNPLVMGGHNLSSMAHFIKKTEAITPIAEISNRIDVIPIIQREIRGFNNLFINKN